MSTKIGKALNQKINAIEKEKLGWLVLEAWLL